MYSGVSESIVLRDRPSRAMLDFVCGYSSSWLCVQYLCYFLIGIAETLPHSLYV